MEKNTITYTLTHIHAHSHTYTLTHKYTQTHAHETQRIHARFRTAMETGGSNTSFSVNHLEHFTFALYVAHASSEMFLDLV